MITLLPLLLLALALGSDWAFLHTLRRFLAPRWVRLCGLLCLSTEIFLLLYLILLWSSREVVLPYPSWTLAALTLLLPKVLFLLLWALFVRPFTCMKGSLYNFLTAALLSLLLGGVVLYGGLRERFLVEVNRVEVVSAAVPPSFDGYRIAQISDIHLGSLSEGDTVFLHTVVDSVLALQPDMVCFTGDLVNIRSVEALPAFRRALRRLRTRRHCVYAVLGNHDYADYDAALTDSMRAADADTLRAMMAEMGWTLLDNRGERIRHRAERRPGDFGDPTEALCILGVGNIGDFPYYPHGNLDTALATLPPKMDIDREFTILLSHNPAHWRQEVLRHPDIDLMLAGHTHGMQLRIAGWSPAVWRYPEWGGLYTQGTQSLYVNTGIGTVGFPMRIGLKPEVTLLTLRTATEPDDAPDDEAE